MVWHIRCEAVDGRPAHDYQPTADGSEQCSVRISTDLVCNQVENSKAHSEPADGIVVWAYDHTDMDVRGILNQFQMPCRLCGMWGAGYDGTEGKSWDVLKKAGHHNQMIWEPSSNNIWFGTRSRIAIFETQKRSVGG
tara:strand:+ start:248 stop:658 length:411 start_codon:yes stop_codon:yes gene_type:complete